MVKAQVENQRPKAVLISDGKAGHYNQSLGVVQRIPGCNYRWIEVKFRSKRRDNFLRVLMRLLGGFCLPERLIRRWLRMALQPETLTEIAGVKRADFIISTGSSVAAINLMMGQLLNAKTVTCRRPSPVGIAHFDLAILPKMYWTRRYRKNVCKTIGVPNTISPEKLDIRREQLQTAMNLPDKRRIGVLIGGEDRYDTITEETATRLVSTLRRVAAKFDCQFLLTTSRRTPPAVVDVLEKGLSDRKICPILVLADREGSIENPVEAIFALSDLILVTEDSFSMVCEAASSGRRVIVLEVEHKTLRRPKRCRVYPEIMRQASVEWCRIENLEGNIQRALTDGTPIQSLCDTETAATAVVRLL